MAAICFRVACLCAPLIFSTKRVGKPEEPKSVVYSIRRNRLPEFNFPEKIGPPFWKKDFCLCGLWVATTMSMVSPTASATTSLKLGYFPHVPSHISSLTSRTGCSSRMTVC